MPLTMRRIVIDWYYLYLNHPGVIRLANTICKVCYWKGLVLQAELSIEKCKKYQQFKNRKSLYEQLLQKIIAALNHGTRCIYT